MVSRKKKVRRKRFFASSQPALLIKLDSAEEEITTGEEVLQMEKECACQAGETFQEKTEESLKEETVKAFQGGREELSEEGGDALTIRGSRIADSLLMQLEDEVIGFINHRLEEHVVKRIKGLLVPVAKLSLKVHKLRKTMDKETAECLSDLEDDLDYILENSKLQRISPQAGEKFNPTLHEEVDFAWNPDRGEAEILATVRDGYFWEYNQEMIVKPQVTVNRRLSA
ncbi:MAG: nucleotide exchange factor GrpE [bacterium]